MKKILVVDGNSIINRAFYGVRPLTTKSGKNTNAIFGMINIITKQLDSIKPDYAVVAFDRKEPTFRHLMYSDYKAGRHPTPDELREQFPDAKECLSFMGFNVMEIAGFEADDIQGTVAYFAKGDPDIKSYILSGDRDLLQLIDDNITVLLATNNDTKAMGREEFREKYGITPELFVEMKALMGDSSDNIPGVRGIGEKTAATLIGDFGTLEAIYENIEDPRITKSVRTKLIEGRDCAFLSRELSRIKTDTPIGVSLDELKYKGFDYPSLYKKFTELELNSFITKFKITEHIDTSDFEKSECQKEGQDLFEKEEKAEEKCNNSHINPYTGCEIEKIALTYDEENIYVYNGSESFSYSIGSVECGAIFSSGKGIVCYEGKALWHLLSRHGVRLSGGTKLLDLALYAYVLNPGGGNSTIPSLASMFLGEVVLEDGITPELLLRLEAAMLKKVAEDGAMEVLWELEIPLLPILAEIEENGFKIDTDGMLEYADALDELAHDLQERIYVQALGEFNINSPKQLGEVLYVRLGLPCKKKKNKNGFSTDAETLEELRQYSPIIDDILEYRQVTKLHGTYAAQLPKLVDGEGRIHTEFKQTLTATGRLSSAEPNLQNIPIRTRMGRQMRKYFISDEGHSLVDADYSQIELRLLAHISDDYNMKEAFISGADIHRKTAAAVFGVPEESVNEEMRKRAKAVNFGIVYGISGFSLAKDIGTSVTEANKYIKSYLLNYPFTDAYLEKVPEEAKALGYTTTLMGRRRYIPELNSSNGALRAFGKRVAMNAPIQGTAADVMKLAMIKVWQRLKADAPKAKIVMQVHDELVVECPDSDVELVKAILTEEMTDVINLSVPLPAEVSSGKNWLEQN